MLSALRENVGIDTPYAAPPCLAVGTIDMDVSTSLPFQERPHDSLRLGLPSLKEDVKTAHPVQIIQETGRSSARSTKAQMLRDLYGVAVPAKMQIEEQILSKFQRLPGLPSSRLGLESLNGALDEFGFESFLGMPEESEIAPPDLHSQMEQRLSMTGSTKPVARGIL